MAYIVCCDAGAAGGQPQQELQQNIHHQPSGINFTCCSCLDSSLVECPPADRLLPGVQLPAETCLSRDALLKEGENSGQFNFLLKFCMHYFSPLNTFMYEKRE